MDGSAARSSEPILPRRRAHECARAREPRRRRFFPTSLGIAAFSLLFSLAARADAIGYEGARHLLNRTGFGANPTEVAQYAALGREAAVDRLLGGARRTATLAPPAFVNEPFTPPREIRRMEPEERMAERRKLVQQGLELRAWWLREMLDTPSPLTERMTLFWHGHFATSQQKVRVGQLMYRQNVLLRREALGNFATMLHEIAKDPAMLIYLDNAGSRRGAPNENFAREVMELFTLGEGHYGETDVKEAARAFTGWSLERDTLVYRYRPFFHDAGVKTVLGATGPLDGDQVLDRLLAQPATAEFIASKMWREFVSPVPNRAEVHRWAVVFRDARYEVKPLLRAVFTSDAFWAPANRASLVKSPVDLVVGTLRTFDIHPFDMRPAAVACAMLGQNLFAPPNVKGWPGGDAWIDSATLLGRAQWIDRVFRGSDPPTGAGADAAGAPAMASAPEAQGAEARMRRMLARGMADYAFDARRWSRSLGADAERPVRIEKLVLATTPVRPVQGAAQGVELVRALVTDPAYQLE